MPKKLKLENELSLCRILFFWSLCDLWSSIPDLRKVALSGRRENNFKLWPPLPEGGLWKIECDIMNGVKHVLITGWWIFSMFFCWSTNISTFYTTNTFFDVYEACFVIWFLSICSKNYLVGINPRSYLFSRALAAQSKNSRTPKFGFFFAHTVNFLKNLLLKQFCHIIFS